MSAHDAPSLPSPSGAPAAPREGRAPELTVVLPVYNEAEALPSVLAEWLAELERLGIDFEIAAYDDGSTDGSLAILRALAADEDRLRVVAHPNRGHGPTILRGYAEAAGEWIFQVDSDGELGPDAFERLWSRRERHDFLVGVRRGRRSSVARSAVTALSRVVVAVLFGRRIRDVNCPYRLMRRERLRPLLAYLPAEPFAPNVLLSGLAARGGLRIDQAPVVQRARRGGAVSLTSGRLLRGCARSLRDAAKTRAAVRRRAT